MSSKKFKPQKKKENTSASPAPGRTTIRQANPCAGQGKIWFFCALIFIALTAVSKITANVLSMTTSDAYVFFVMLSGVCILLLPAGCLITEVFGIRDCLNDLKYGGDGSYLIPLIVELIVTIPWLVYAVIALASIIQVATE